MKSKYKIQTKMNEDKFQFKLCENGIETNKSPLARITTIDYTQNVFCPFCLHKEQLNKFFISTKKGIHKRLGKCPECENRMWFETLLRMLKWTPKEYAVFVYEYPYAHFWSKCSYKFEIWKQRLYNLNMSYQFWQTYKYLKNREGYTEVEINE